MNTIIVDVIIEKLTNGAVTVSVGKDRDRHSFLLTNRAGFINWQAAERHVLKEVKRLLREFNKPPVKKCKS